MHLNFDTNNLICKGKTNFLDFRYKKTDENTGELLNSGVHVVISFEKGDVTTIHNFFLKICAPIISLEATATTFKGRIEL